MSNLVPYSMFYPYLTPLTGSERKRVEDNMDFVWSMACK